MRLLKQVGALCVRRADDGSQEVLLVTSRETGRWVIPKGWQDGKLKGYEAAAREASEEAGVTGKITNKAIGSFRYSKRLDSGERSVLVSVFLLAVEEQKARWPEQHQRQRAWFTANLAAQRVSEPGLKKMIKSVAHLGASSKKSALTKL